MIVWKSRVETEETPQFPDLGRRSFRTVLEVSLTDVELRREIEFERSPGHWKAWDWKGWSITRSFILGHEHFWYDGENCFFSVGFVHFRWRGWGCKRCQGTH